MDHGLGGKNDGRRDEQWSLFYQFRLDERVPKGHLLRRMERGHKLYKVDADIDLADNIDPAELQKIFATLVPKAAGRTKASARKKR